MTGRNPQPKHAARQKQRVPFYIPRNPPGSYGVTRQATGEEIRDAAKRGA